MQEYFLFLQNHWLLSSALAFITILLILFEFIKIRNNAAQISPSQLTQLINRQNAVVLDLRPADLFASGHIIGSISLPTKELTEKNKKIEKYKSKPIVLVCATGQDSQRVATELQKQGYDIKTLAGGLKSWREAELPVVKGAGND